MDIPKHLIMFNTTTTITIGGRDWRLRPTVRALFVWEQIAGRPFEIKSTLDNYLYFYSLLLANNDEFPDWDTFIAEVDSDPNIVAGLQKILAEHAKVTELLEGDGDGDDKKKE